MDGQIQAKENRQGELQKGCDKKKSELASLDSACRKYEGKIAHHEEAVSSKKEKSRQLDDQLRSLEEKLKVLRERNKTTIDCDEKQPKNKSAENDDDVVDS